MTHSDTQVLEYPITHVADMPPMGQHQISALFDAFPNVKMTMGMPRRLRDEDKLLVEDAAMYVLSAEIQRMINDGEQLPLPNVRTVAFCELWRINTALPDNWIGRAHFFNQFNSLNHRAAAMALFEKVCDPDGSLADLGEPYHETVWSEMSDIREEWPTPEGSNNRAIIDGLFEVFGFTLP